HEGKRFVMRGSSGFYTLRSGDGSDSLWVVESETSANSLWEYCSERYKNATIISHGSVENIPKDIPYKEIPKKYLILDYDGNQSLYKSRLEKYNHLGLRPLKLELPKGEDINSLYCRNEILNFRY